ncbi:MAG: type III-B CRISPR module RAMP protein Cmr4 [Brevinematales bacterium]|nr:type III-B CRISPR module RAMP protein Cmr4 [Brevinematales bacterium]
MYRNSALLTYYTLTPLHMGAGSSVSYVDLPIQRERHTSFPMMAGSGIKGVFRSLAERKWNSNDKEKEKVNKIFGPEDGSEYSSSVAFTDAKILLYPVRSVKGVFAWITCPLVLKRFKEDLKSINSIENFNVSEIPDDTKIIIAQNSALKIDGNKVGLEEFVFEVEGSNNINNEIINKLKNYIPKTETTEQSFESRFAIVSDNVFADLVNYAVEVRTRIKIDQQTGTAQSGALFTVEMVPSEAVFYSLLFTKEINVRRKETDSNSKPKENNQEDEASNNINVMDEIKSLFNNGTNNDTTVFQFGGDETIGLGFVKVKINIP